MDGLTTSQPTDRKGQTAARQWRRLFHQQRAGFLVYPGGSQSEGPRPLEAVSGYLVRDLPIGARRPHDCLAVASIPGSSRQPAVHHPYSYWHGCISDDLCRHAALYKMGSTMAFCLSNPTPDPSSHRICAKAALAGSFTVGYNNENSVTPSFTLVAEHRLHFPHHLP